ncbi:MAG: hypothetical protein A4E32_01576 [Methanomassiliicoccales archaeon PtaU1.Bin124]|nr:MAG: hypothetical protein A4E32_01576 [Methanomassiliicoccales archaeon PtaU1.Bin124]
MNISRRSLCDNCVADVCFKRSAAADERISHCEIFRSPFVAFKKCSDCGSIYELFSNISSLDFDKCPKCNDHEQLFAEEFGQ